MCVFFVVKRLLWVCNMCMQGASNSGQYARIDMLALELETKLPHFEVVRIIKTPNEWQVSFLLSIYIPSYIRRTADIN